MHARCGHTCRGTWPCPGWPCEGICSSVCSTTCPVGRPRSWVQICDASRSSQRRRPSRTGQLRPKCCGYYGRYQRRDFPRTWPAAQKPRGARSWAAPVCPRVWCAATRPFSRMAASRPKPGTWRARWLSTRSIAATLRPGTPNSTGCRPPRPDMHSPS